MFSPCTLLQTVLVLLLAMAFPVGTAAQEPPLGPLTAEDGSPLHRIALTPAVEGPDPVAEARWRAEVWMGYSNIFEQDSAQTHVLFLDMERLITTFTLRRGLTPDLEVGGRLTLETTGGGVLDGFISGWHQALGVGNANRERFPADAYVQRFSDGGRVRLDVPRRTFHPEDLRLFAKWRWLGDDTTDEALSVRGVVRIPTATNDAGEERTDLAVLLAGRTRWGPTRLHATAGVSTLRARGSLEGILRTSSWYLTVGAEQRLAGWVSALGQLSLSSPRVRGFENSEIGGAPINLVLGFAGRLGEGWQWEASFQEDVPPDTPSVDFTLGVGLRRTF